MKSPERVNLEKAAKTEKSGGSKRSTKKSNSPVEKNHHPVNVSLRIATYHKDFLLELTADEMKRLNKHTSMSDIVRKLIDEEIKRRGS